MHWMELELLGTADEAIQKKEVVEEGSGSMRMFLVSCT